MDCATLRPIESLLETGQRVTLSRWSDQGLPIRLPDCASSSGEVLHAPEVDTPPACPKELWVTANLAERTRDCYITLGTRFVINYSPDDLASEHQLLSQEEETMPKQPVEYQPIDDTPRKVKHVEPDPPPPEPEEVEVPITAAPVPAIPAPQTASLAVPQEVDVKKLVEDSQGASGFTVLLAVVAVAGGGAAWKFYQNWAKNKHEQAMKALEIEQSKVDKQQNDHQACASKNAALVTQVEGLGNKLTSQVESIQSKVSTLEAKMDAIPTSPPEIGVSSKDFDKVNKRLKALEKKQVPNA